jgi:murein DD-endopeptidase MepM/ murein hydrolase activator NlpD
MRRGPRFPRTLPIAVVTVSFLAGVAVDSLLRTYGPPKPAADQDVGLKPDATINTDARTRTPASAPVASDGGRTAVPTTGVITAAPLRVPIDGANVEAMKGGFEEQRAGHAHEAVDILAPRNTPIHAVADGTIAKLFFSKGGGGNTIYEFDPTGHYAYYYAHLERYADEVREGQTVHRGDVIGYVGTSGNAPPNTPHLHFGVFELDADRRWWHGKAVDPYPFFK